MRLADPYASEGTRAVNNEVDIINEARIRREVRMLTLSLNGTGVEDWRRCGRMAPTSLQMGRKKRTSASPKCTIKRHGKALKKAGDEAANKSSIVREAIARLQEDLKDKGPSDMLADFRKRKDQRNQ